jgi:CRISPR-associated protein Csd1
LILQALEQCYQLLRDDPESGVAPRFYSSEPISYAFQLSSTGELLAVMPLYEVQGSKRIPARQLVPEHERRSGTKPPPCYLCDHAGYVLGNDGTGNQERGKQYFEAFRQLHEEILRDVADEGAQALLAFLRNRQAGEISEPALKDLADELVSSRGNIVFRLAGDNAYLHQRPALRKAWEDHRLRSASSTVGQCLVTGEYGPIAVTHPAIKGVVGAQSVGAALVSFNASAFESYGKTQSFNAPVSESAAFAYTTALNHMLRSRQNSMLLGDSTVVFWAERRGPEEALFAELMGGPEATEKGFEAETTQLLRDTLQRMRNGQPIGVLGVDHDVRMHILGLAPNAGRISVRFYHTETFGGLVQQFLKHFDDIEIVADGRRTQAFPPVWQLLAETAVQRKRDNIPRPLIGSVMNAILEATPYPHSLYQAILMRIRAEKDINWVRAGIVKGCLTRWSRRDHQSEEVCTVALNEENTQQGYLLGRLFALLERAQLNAQGEGLNRTIRTTYFSSASATPATVFPQLMRLAQHHIAKEPEKNKWVDRDIANVVDKLDVSEQGVNGFPASLSYQEQGLFMLGYYQQRQEFYRPRQGIQEKNEEEE